MKRLFNTTILTLSVLFAGAWTQQAYAQANASDDQPYRMPKTNAVYDSPQKLGEQLNSEAEESMPILSADGKTLYFVRMLHPDNLGGKFAGHDIWYSRLDADSSWSEPKNTLFNLNNKGNNAILGFNATSEEVYLLNRYNSSDSRKPGISVATQEKTNWWSLPESLNIPKLKTDGYFYNAFVNKEGNLAIVSMKTRDMDGEEDLFVSRKDENGEWSELLSLGETINTAGFEISPFLTEDGKTLYFSSNGHKGLGDADIYRVERLDDSWTNWSVPENLGRPINSKGFDAAYFEHPNGTVLFISNRDGYLADMYSTRIREAGTEEDENLLAENTRKEREALEEEERRRSAEADRRAREEENRRLTESEKEEIVVDNTYPLEVSIYFAFDSDELSAESKAKLTEIFNEYTSGDDVRVELIGHTDDIGTPEYNERLSLRRARAAQNFLHTAGLAEERLKTEGRGELEPSAPNDTPEGRRQNRRVKIVVVK